MFLAFLAAISGSADDIANKHLLGKLKLPLKEYLPFVFLVIGIMCFFTFRIGYHFDQRALSFWNLILFATVIVTSIGWNTLLAKSLQTEPLHEYETIILMTPIATVLFAAIFLPAERNIHILVAGIVASLALFISHFRKHHFELTKTARQTLLAVFLIAIEAVVLRNLLNFYSPALIYAIRVWILTLVFVAIYKPDWKILIIKPVFQGVMIASLFGIILMILKYYCFAKFGVVATTMVMLLAPVLTFMASYFYFSEHRNFRRDMTCATVVVGCIIYALLAGKA